ncbi:MAG: pyruvate:ferredoxin (flavodoxin) oxidoreductase [Pirellulaceae bacterium]|jgi:pyruvate-ferredoxin/flavodoxin oxidoreductase|nr:pyruvate:ferredoxin (flavodoxin) oxidoreductase [Pirellulaceae bacterium]
MAEYVTVDGNEAVARVAYAASEVIAIYPITPASPMGELADTWSASGRQSALGTVPNVIEMQSEGGAAGALHGALQGGALATTFTASQGLLLMLPNLFKIAGELSPCAIHVAARSIATHALSIFGDHSDVMAARGTGWAMLASSSVQAAQDLALVSHAATLKCRIPFLHFFDGFRTSHEINKIELLGQDTIHDMLDRSAIAQHRLRSLDPDQPVLRGTAQNPDVFFQAREAVNPFYERTSDSVQAEMDRLFELTGRQYQLFSYFGHPQATRVIVMMGSGCGAAREAVERLDSEGQAVGLLQVLLYRPFDVERFIAALPNSTRSIAVLDRTKEPGAIGEPLYLDVVAALAEGWDSLKSQERPLVSGGRFGLSSKEFTPAMAAAVLEHLSQDSNVDARSRIKRHFTIGIHDDVSLTSLPWDADRWHEPSDVIRAVFYGLGSDGTVGANKNSVKIIGEETDLHAQGYFVYDSKKAGAATVSHLRFSPRPIESTYLIRQANFVACHQFDFLRRMSIVDIAADDAILLLNSPFDPLAVWEHLPRDVQEQIIAKRLKLYVIDADSLAQSAGLAGRINTIMQTCFFALSGILPREQAIDKIKSSIEKTYSKRGAAVVRKNFEVVDAALAGLHAVSVPSQATSRIERTPPVSRDAPDFVSRVTGQIIAGLGDLLPVSAMPIDGTFPTGTARYEKRNIAQLIPIWDPDICIECGLCAFVCPHAAIRTKQYPVQALSDVPADFLYRAGNAKHAGQALTIQVAPEDCTGCGVCVDVCPAKSKEVAKHKSINMRPKAEHLEQEKRRFDAFMKLPEIDRTSVKTDSVKGSQLLLPLFEYSGACAGCGETPYLKLMSQLFGDRSVIANATGCSSIFGGNLPTTPWSKDAAGRGPAWANSLFEDNAEFGLGLRLALDSKLARTRQLLTQQTDMLGQEKVSLLVDSPLADEADYAAQRGRIAELQPLLSQMDTESAHELSILLNSLARRSLWIVGGDGWAYDIGFGGLDHALASGRDVNILVLDTGVYSNTGGQASKATPRGATAKFASDGREARRKDLGMMAVAYGNTYVAQVAIGANPAQCIRAFHEAESYRGPSLILAYSHCIAHGIDMSTSMTHQKDLVKCGFWPLYRYDPRHAHDSGHPFRLDSHKPSLRFKDVAMQEARFAMLVRSNPAQANRLLDLAQRDIDDTWHYYEQLAGVERAYSDLVDSR